jgi:hypothetical protein
MAKKNKNLLKNLIQASDKKDKSEKLFLQVTIQKFIKLINF